MPVYHTVVYYKKTNFTLIKPKYRGNVICLGPQYSTSHLQWSPQRHYFLIILHYFCDKTILLPLKSVFFFTLPYWSGSHSTDMPTLILNITACSSKTVVSTDTITWYHNPEVYNLNSFCHYDVKSNVNSNNSALRAKLILLFKYYLQYCYHITKFIIIHSQLQFQSLKLCTKWGRVSK
jgi:hypothetical protein